MESDDEYHTAMLAKAGVTDNGRIGCLLQAGAEIIGERFVDKGRVLEDEEIVPGKAYLVQQLLKWPDGRETIVSVIGVMGEKTTFDFLKPEATH